MSSTGRGADRAPRAVRTERCVSWFSAVVLFVLLSATSDPGPPVTSVAQNRVEVRSERHSYEAAALPGHLPAGPCCESVARPSLRHLPWSHSVTEYGLPLPRAPTA
ncbi:MAG TPA: hypothetical protein VFD82_17070 [Planctomycetota bacterium]|nr:hypothetical protein [Planctomycetota bacterium]